MKRTTTTTVAVTSDATDHHRRLESALIRFGVQCEVSAPLDQSCTVSFTYDDERYDETAFKILMRNALPVVAEPPSGLNKSAWCITMLEKS